MLAKGKLWNAALLASQGQDQALELNSRYTDESYHAKYTLASHRISKFSSAPLPTRLVYNLTSHLQGELLFSSHTHVECLESHCFYVISLLRFIIKVFFYWFISDVLVLLCTMSDPHFWPLWLNPINNWAIKAKAHRLQLVGRKKVFRKENILYVVPSYT